MSTQEIERKFLVHNTSYRELCTKTISIKQGYLQRDPRGTVRVRITPWDATLTIKGPRSEDGTTCTEIEKPLEFNEALAIMEMAENMGRIVVKTRYIVPWGDYLWEVDEYQDVSISTVAEIELPDADALTGANLPSWVGTEVTGDPRYYNANI